MNYQMKKLEEEKYKYNETLLRLFHDSDFSQDYFSKTIGISRTRLLNILYNKQSLKLNTFLSYIVTLDKTFKIHINIKIKKQ